MNLKTRTGTGEVVMADEVQYASGDVSQSLDGGLSARALLSSIRRHWGLISALVLGLCLAGAFVGLGLPAWYQAESVLVIHARPQRLAGVQELPDPVPDFAVIHSEVDVLQSRSVIEPVVRSLGLWRLPEFQKRDIPGAWSWNNLQARVQELWDTVNGSGATASPPKLEVSQGRPGDQVSQEQIDDAVEKYKRYLNINTDGRSMTISVMYRAWSPEQAAAIVNAHVKSYQDFEEQGKLRAVNRANAALNTQVADLRSQLQTAETAVTRYREEHHLTGAAKDSGALNTQLANLNSQLITARADLAETEARAARIGIAANGSGADSIPEVIGDATIQGLRGQEGQLVAREADLSKYHGDAYPELQRVRASLQNLRGQIGREIARSHSAALQLVDRARTRERSLQQSITDLTKQVNSADAGLQQLQVNAESIRNQLREFEKRAEETAADPALLTGNSTLVSPANPTATKTSPKAPMLAFGGGFVGLTLGGLLAVFLEFRDNTFRTSSQVEQQIGSLRVGATPRATGRRGRKSPADIILNDNGSVVAEAFRLSWANIQLAIEDPRAAAFGTRRSGVALGITSAATGEGKSTHALAFARTAALAGERVVLVDADLRRSGVSKLLHQQFQFTLKDFLQGRCAADDTLAVEERSGMHFVPSRPVDAPWTTHDLKRFSDFVDYLKRQFAIVIIDLPPVLGLAETIRLSVAADSIALVIRWGRTERQMVQFAQDALRSAGVSASAAILNDIDLSAQQRRGYRDRTIIYTDEGLYRTAPGKRVAQPLAVAALDAGPDITAPAGEPHHAQEQYQSADPAPADGPESPARSDIERLYNRYRHG